jgi:hypothetical protein
MSQFLCVSHFHVYTTCPSLILFSSSCYRNAIWWRLQIMKVFAYQSNHHEIFCA